MENTMRVWVYQVAMRQPNIQVTGIPEGKENVAEATFEEIMTENLSSF